MTAYRNLTANVTHPANKVDRCAKAILDELNAHGGRRVYVWAVDAAIMNAKADLRLKAVSVRALRNSGYPIITAKARHESWYQLDGTSNEHEQHRKMVVHEEYTRIVGTCRVLAGAVAARPGDLALGASLRHAQMLGIALGTDVAIGKTIAEVAAELTPIP